jgi:type II secretory pathway pseudopilin PulG
MTMNGASRKYRRLGRDLRGAAGFSLVEIVVSTAVMAILGTALGSLLSATTYQSARALVDQRVNTLVNREVNFFRSVPYSALTNTGLVDQSGNPAVWQQDPQNPNVYYWYEGNDGNSYLMTIEDQTGTTDFGKCRYHYQITRKLTVSNDPNNPYKTVDLLLEWWGPNPDYHSFMNQTQQPVDANGDWKQQEDDLKAVHQTIAINTIYRYP